MDVGVDGICRLWCPSQRLLLLDHSYLTCIDLLTASTLRANHDTDMYLVPFCTGYIIDLYLFAWVSLADVGRAMNVFLVIGNPSLRRMCALPGSVDVMA